MKALMEILSGERYRKNRLEKITFAQAMSRLENSQFAGDKSLSAFAYALAFTVGCIVEGLLYNTIHAYKPAATTLDQEKISDLAAFAAWRSKYLFDSDREYGETAGKPQDLRYLAIRDKANEAATIMYPIHPKVQDAIDKLRAAEKSHNTVAFNAAFKNAVDSCLGLESPAPLPMRRELGPQVYLNELKDHITVGAVFAANRNMLATQFEIATRYF